MLELENAMAAQFQSTRWSLIRQAADPENSSLRERAWSEFDDLYRRPLFAFIRRWGWREPEAEDLLQGFLAKLANRDWLADADEERGKMRTFLLNRLKAHLLDARKHDAAQKRGGGVEQISVDDSSAAAEQLLAEEPDTRVFDREWAQALFDRVLAGLQSIAEAAGNGEVCRLLRAQLTEDSPERLREVAARLGRTEGSVRMALQRMRDQFRSRMRAEVAETLLPGEPAESVKAELEYLASVLRG